MQLIIKKLREYKKGKWNPMESLVNVQKYFVLIGAFSKKILSGILFDQIDKVINIYSDWIDLKPYSVEEGWVLLHGELQR